MSFNLAVVLPRWITYCVNSGTEGVRPPTPSNHRLQCGLPGYLILFATHTFVPQRQLKPSRPPSPLVFLPISTHFTATPEFRLPLLHSSSIVSKAVHGLSPWISLLTCQSAYAPFTPSKSGQRLLPTYYRGCWHVVSRSFLLCYRHYLHRGQRFTTRRPSSLTRRCWFRVSPIDQYPSLLPPVGVWAVSQSQCGRSTSQSGYRSSTW